MGEHKGLAVARMIADLGLEILGIEPRRRTADYTTAPPAMTPTEQAAYNVLRVSGVAPTPARRAATMAIPAVRSGLYREGAQWLALQIADKQRRPDDPPGMRAGMKWAVARLDARAGELEGRDDA